MDDEDDSVDSCAGVHRRSDSGFGFEVVVTASPKLLVVVYTPCVCAVGGVLLYNSRKAPQFEHVGRVTWKHRSVVDLLDTIIVRRPLRSPRCRNWRPRSIRSILLAISASMLHQFTSNVVLVEMDEDLEETANNLNGRSLADSLLHAFHVDMGRI